MSHKHNFFLLCMSPLSVFGILFFMHIIEYGYDYNYVKNTVVWVIIMHALFNNLSTQKQISCTFNFHKVQTSTKMSPKLLKQPV